MSIRRGSCPFCARDASSIESRLNDHEVYLMLVRLEAELKLRSDHCWSMTSATALRVTAHVARQLGSGVYIARCR